MLRSKSQNQNLKCKSEEAGARYKIQRNLCVTLLRKAKRDYYENLELGKVNDSKKFGNTVKSVFGNNKIYIFQLNTLRNLRMFLLQL